MNEQLAVNVLLCLMGITVLFGLLGLATWFSSLRDGAPKTHYWCRFFAGISHMAVGAAGIVSHAFMDERRLVTYLLGWGFLLMGAFCFRAGWRLRKQMLATGKS